MYKIINDSVIQRDDGAFIPINNGNADYQVYLAWVAAGNTATPADAPPAPDTTPDLATQLAAALINANVISAGDLHPDTLADVNAQLADAGQAQIATPSSEAKNEVA